MKINVVTRSGGNLAISLTGSLDTETYVDFEKILEGVFKDPVKILILDLGGLEYISTMGISIILKARKLTEGCQGEFSIVNVQPQVQKIFDIIKAIPSMEIFSSITEADAYFAAIQGQTKEQERIKKKK